MATTSPDNIFSPDAGDAYALTSDLDAMADSVQTALTDLRSDIPADLSSDITALENTNQIYGYRPADSSALAAVTGMRLGDRALQVDTGIHFRYDGSAWKAWESNWITWSTAPTGITVGTGGSASSLQRYKWMDGRIYFDFKFVLGTSGASVVTNPNLNLPVSIALSIPSGVGQLATGDVQLYDTSVPAINYGKVSIAGATTALLRTYTGSGTGSISSSAPWTWAAGDIIAGGFWADPA